MKMLNQQIRIIKEGKKKPDQRHRKYIWQNPGSKFTQPKEENVYEDTRSLENIK